MRRNLREAMATATGPDREIDRQLELALVPGALEHPWSTDFYVISGPGHADYPPGQGYLPDAYTASTDAALALIERCLPGWCWRVEHYPGTGADASLWRAHPSQFVVNAPTPAVALVCALLTTLDQREKEEGGNG